MNKRIEHQKYAKSKPESVFFSSYKVWWCKNPVRYANEYNYLLSIDSIQVDCFIFISAPYILYDQDIIFYPFLFSIFSKKILGNFLIENHFKNHVLLINQYFVVHSPLFKFFERVHHIFSLCTASFISTTWCIKWINEIRHATFW